VCKLPHAAETINRNRDRGVSTRADSLCGFADQYHIGVGMAAEQGQALAIG
jgi:hypothetical protein